MKKEKYKLPEHYFCINDMTPAFEVEECIMQECESAGLEKNVIVGLYAKGRALKDNTGFVQDV